MNIDKIRKHSKTAKIKGCRKTAKLRNHSKTAALAFLLGAVIATGCGGSPSEAVELSSMTAEERTALEAELTETLEVDGVKLMELYNTGDTASGVTSESESASPKADDGPQDVDLSDDLLDDTSEEAEENGKSESGVDIGEKQRYFAVAVTVKGGGDHESSGNGGDREDSESDGDHGDGESATVTYQIYDLADGLPSKSTRPMQNIEVEDYYLTDEVPCVIQDMNFDGANDVYLWLWAGAQNSQGKFFLWNEAKGCFEENQALGELTSPVARADRNIIHEHVHISGFEYTDTLYRWEGDQLIPVRRILQREPNATSLQGEVYDWYDGYWEPMYERKILVSAGEWSQSDYDKAADLAEELEAYFDPEYEW